MPRLGVGRTRIKLAKMLQEEIAKLYPGEEVTVDPEELTPQPNGGGQFADWTTWHGWFKAGRSRWSICSWDTMSEAVKNGFSLELNGGGSKRAHATIEVHAKETK